ncbi:MAG: nickel pincer cofactor biosynthesis protein LarC [Lachnospiraceae bacterium]|nr:nickel pincer cofactor biosynthesis protein LarC [Lachnospiraceae bacterium]
MKLLYIDCSMGAAGDMLTGALTELFPDADTVISELNSFGISGVCYEKERTVKCGISGTHITVRVNGTEEDEHMHDDGDDHDHHHSSLADIEKIIAGLNLAEIIKQDICAVYNLIAEAESHVHGVPVSDIHFHEVGRMDAIADIAAVCYLMDKLGRPKVTASPIHVGSGQVKCAHGLLPVPAPATAYILKGCPVYGGNIKGELCTPTGAALLKYFADDFGSMPAMTVSGIGYGMGKKDFEAANCVRAIIGECTANEMNTDGSITEMICNIDDMTGEELGFATERLMSEGALDVYTVAAYMKKGRPGQILHVLCKNADKEKMVHSIFKYTKTIGIRYCVMERYTLERHCEEIDTEYGVVHQKISSGFGVERRKTEYDDLARIAVEKGISLEEARALLSAPV